MLRNGFRRVSDDLTLAQAADMLRESPSRATMQQIIYGPALTVIALNSFSAEASGLTMRFWHRL
jgi:hypothetical protein